MAGMAGVSNLRKFSSGGYRYPNRADLLVLFRIILLSLHTCGITGSDAKTAPESEDRPAADSNRDLEVG